MFKLLKNKNLLSIVYLALIVLLINSCGSTTVTISSSPDKADIYIRKLSDNTMKKLGSTPLTIKTSDVSDELEGSGPMYLELRKDGYFKHNAIITDLNVRDIELKLKLTAKNFLEDSNTIDTVINNLFQCQKLIKQKEYDKAREVLNKIKITFPFLSVIYEFEGGIYILEKKFPQALNSFKTAIKYNSGNIEALRLKRAIEKEYELTTSTNQGGDGTSSNTNQ